LGANPKALVPSKAILGRLANKVTPLEMELLKQAGLEKFIEANPQLSGEKVSAWIRENGPKVEVVDYGMEGKVSSLKRELDKLHGDFDAAGIRPLQDDDGTVIGWKYADRKTTADKLPFPFDDYAKRFEELYASGEAQKVGAGDLESGPRATSYYDTVSALPTNEPMPEWTTTKSGKNVQRVDVALPHEYKGGYIVKDKNGKEFGQFKDSEEASNQKERLEEEYPHLKPFKTFYGSGENIFPKWKQDNLHENLPNTLGWAMLQYKTGPKGEKIAVVVEAQSRWGQSVREAQKNRDTVPPAERGVWEKENGHPLLKDYNRLILKSAIQQAKKEGATHIMVSDGETAMMTEGHDNLNGWETVDGGRVPKGEEPKQAQGMRLNYDKILPQIMKDLTGVSGEKVSLGEHKNAYVGNDRVAQEHEGLAMRREQRSNLIFRNPDGTPKTDVSGVMYPIDSTPVAYTLTRNKYQPKLTGTPEVDNIRPGIDSNVTPKSLVQRIASRFNPYGLCADIESKEEETDDSEEILEEII